MAVRIITDSTVDTGDRYKDRITVVPLTVTFGETEYIDGVTMDKMDFYRMLEQSPELPRTSQASPDTFARIFRTLQEQGEEAVVITVTSKLSGTYQSARIAAEDFPNVRVVDSRNVSIGSGVLAECALRCAEEGMGLDELAEHLIQVRDDVCLLARLETLEYLLKGGRISRTTAFAAGMLNIKPVVTVKDGELAVLGKARGSKKANNLLIEAVQKNGVDLFRPVLLGYSGLSDELLQSYISDSRAIWEGNVDPLEQTQLCSVIGTHAGPGAVGVAFFRKKAE